MHRSTAISLTTFLGLIGTVIPAAAAGPPVTVSYSTFDYPGALSTTIYGINLYQDFDRQYASFVGTYTDSAGSHGFLSTAGNLTPINVPNAYNTFANGINNNGEIVGTYATEGSGSLGPGTYTFLLSQGTFTTIEPCSDALGFGVNDNGTVVGNVLSDGSGEQVEGFVASPSAGCAGFPGPSKAILSQVSAINNAGTFVGDYQTAKCSNGNCWTIYHGMINGVKHYNVPGATDTQLYGINDSGYIVGWYDGEYGSQYVATGFLREHGTIINIFVPGSAATIAYGIDNENELGQYNVVGGWTDYDGKQHGFIAQITHDSNETSSKRRNAFKR